LLPPYDPAQPVSAAAGGAFELGDRVVVLRATGAPPFGAGGTVIGVYEDACELLMDEEFAGETCLEIVPPRGDWGGGLSFVAASE